MNIDRYTPYRFNNGIPVKNRIVVPAMASQTADENGFVTDRTIEHYQHLAQSGAGVIFAEYTFIHKTGRGEANQLGVDSNDKIEGLKKITSAIHQSSALAGLQLVHVGGKSSTQMTGGPLMGPSAVAVPVKGWEPEVPVAMTDVQIQNWIDWFLDAAGRAVLSGFDLVELHAAHGYGLNQWLSPLTNHRTDLYGGTVENRSRILFQIAKRIKTEFPNTLLSIRLPAQDYVPGGLTVDDMTWIVSHLESIGVDLINVSSGIGGWRRPEGNSGQGYLVKDAAQIKTNTKVPVIGVGGIVTGEFVDEILQSKFVDFAAIGRAILEAPELWREKNLKTKSNIGVIVKYAIQLIVIGIVVIGSSAGAGVNKSKFSCSYTSGAGTRQVITFEGPHGIDLSYPNVQNEIELKINNDSSATVFQVQKFPTHVGSTVIYSHAHPFFISDLRIQYDEKQVGGPDQFTGTWRVDHPPVYILSCAFADDGTSLAP